MRKIIIASFCSVSCAFLPPTQTKRIPRPPDNLNRQIQSLDAQKKNLCTITINSTEETEVFRSHLPMFNHIELVEPESTDWFQTACSSGIKCDVLMISGHFGGSFFGKRTKASLSSNTLETESCRRTCDGILRHPREVYLFGCNTLAGKSKDHRSPQEYIQVLMRDGFDANEAQALAAIRYSPLGNSYRDKLTRSFAGVPRIYGFDSVGPSGANVKNSLDQYFLGIGNYEKYFENSNFKSQNELWSRHMRNYSNAQAEGADPQGIQDSFACRLQDPHVSSQKKLSSVEEIFSNEASLLANIEYLDYYFQGQRKYSSAVNSHRVSELESMIRYNLMKNTDAKSFVSRYLQKELPGLLSFQVALLNIGKQLGWWGPTEYDNKLRFLFGDFIRGIKVEHADILCSRDISIPGLKASNFKAGVWGHGEFKAIACLAPKDPVIADKLAVHLSRANRQNEETYFLLAAIGAVGLKTSAVEKSVTTFFKKINYQKQENAPFLVTGMDIINTLSLDCKSCELPIQFLLSKNHESHRYDSEYRLGYEAAFLYKLKRPELSAQHLEQALRIVLSPSSANDILRAEIRVLIQGQKSLCLRLPMIKQLEDQYLPAQQQDWSYSETSGPGQVSVWIGTAVNKSQMLMSDDLERICI